MRDNIRLDAQDTTSGLLCEMKRIEQQLENQHTAQLYALPIVLAVVLMLLVYAISSWPSWGWLLADVRLRWFLYGVGATVLSLVTVLMIGVCIGVGRIKEHPSL